MAQRIIDGYRVARELTPEQAEEEHLHLIEGRYLPFGYKNDEWKKLVSQMQSGDELWLSRSGVDEAGLNGHEGLLLVRNGAVIDSLLTRIGVQ